MGLFGSLAVAAVSSALSGGKKSAKQKIKPFTPANLYTPSGNATWSKGNGTATLSPELQKYQDYYSENANNYQSQINSYFAPNRNNFYTSQPTAGTSGFTPLSFEQWSASQPKNNQFTGRGGFDSSGVYHSTVGEMGLLGLKSFHNGNNNEGATQAGYQQYLNSNPAVAGTSSSAGVFDQAGFDAANANYVSPEQTMYDKLRTLSQPAEDQARADNESRLFSQGLLGASNGQGFNPGIKAFNDSAHQADLQRELTALTSTPDLIAKWQNLQNTQSTGAQGLSQIPNELLKIGANIGVGAGTNSINAATAQNQIANSQGDFWKSAAGSIGSAVSSGVNQLFSQPSSSNSPFSFKPSTNNLGTDFNFGSTNFLK